MPYITKGNVTKIISLIDVTKLPNNFGELKGKVYKQTITFFSVLELNNLLLRKEFYRKPNSFIEFYQKIDKKEDTYKYTYEGGTPAYHLALDCPRLNSNFDSYEIPIEIQEKGKEAVIRFRQFFAQNKVLLDTNPDAFYGKMTTAFALQTLLKPVDYKNSGPELIEIGNLQDLEETINKLLTDFQELCWKSTPEKKAMINKFARLTFLAFPPHNQKDIKNNETGFSDKEIRDFLKDFAENYKLPIIKYLKDFYRIYGRVLSV